MDNDNKIIKMNEQRHKEVLMFLQNELEPLRRKDSSETYNLEKEYAKTKKNKSPFVVLVLLGCLGVVALVSFGLSKSIDKTNKEIKVNLEEFDDVNLKNLLDTVARTQSQYEAAVRNKVTLEAEKKSELSAAQSKRDNDILVITSMNLSDKKAEKKQIEEINAIYEDRVKVIEASYETPLTAAAAEVAEYRKKLDEYDKSKLSVEQEKSVDSQRKLQDLERKQLVDKYEARIASLEESLADTRKSNNENMKTSLFTVSNKYQKEIDALDPVIKDSKASEIVRRTRSSSIDENDFSNHDLYADGVIEKEDLKDELEKVKSLYDDYKYLDKMVIDIPHKNTIGDYVKATDKIVDDISVSFADLTYSLYENVVDLENKKHDLEVKIAELTNDVEGYQELTGGNITPAPVEENDEETEFFVGLLTYFNTNAVVQSARTKETIYIYVHPDIRDQFPDEGLVAELRSKRIKGKVVKLLSGKYVFVPDKDRSGKPLQFDVEGLSGTPVKITVK